jgi:iron complex outermembrane receptor protein
MKVMRIAGWILAHALIATRVYGQTGTPDLKRMTIEELMALEITAVSRVPEPSTAAPAAVHVITREDIRRSGATSLPEALRLAPGIQVARIDAARYAIGARGFADRLSRSVLVLIDGRAVYSPLFAGTYWETQSVLLADVDRIEVIRGPGGTLWGANAVNGIINIVPRPAAETQDALVTATAGTGLPGMIGVRHGGERGNLAYRAYAQGFARSPMFHASGADYDDWRMVQAGFRGDWTLARSRSVTLQGDIYGGRLGQQVRLPDPAFPFSRTVTRDAPVYGGNVLARWSGPIGSRGEFQLQTFYDRTKRDELPVAESRRTFDLDFQHRFRAARRHDLVWGAGYRLTSDEISTTPPTTFVPPERTDNLFSTFVHDDIAVVADRLRVIVGTKLEHNAYSGVEVQPSGRLVWTPDATNTFVWSVTRAVRTPSRVETDYSTRSVADPAVPAFVQLRANPGFEPEALVAYEAGYRVRPMPRLFVTASAFFNDLDDTLSTELQTPFVEPAPPPARLILPVMFANGLHGNTHGVEVTADFRPAPWWRWTGAYSYLRVEMTRDPGSNDVSQERRYEGLSPRHQVDMRASFDLPRAISLDWIFRYVSELPAGPVPGYATSDLRVAWQVRPELELAVIGRDLHHARHLEWPGEGPSGGVFVRRTAQVSATWRP